MTGVPPFNAARVDEMEIFHFQKYASLFFMPGEWQKYFPSE
jgi:hypothetical protein